MITKSVKCSTSRIRVNCISVCVGMFGLTEAVAGGAAVATRESAGVSDLVDWLEIRHENLTVPRGWQNHRGERSGGLLEEKDADLRKLWQLNVLIH